MGTGVLERRPLATRYVTEGPSTRVPLMDLLRSVSRVKELSLGSGCGYGEFDEAGSVIEPKPGNNYIYIWLWNFFVKKTVVRRIHVSRGKNMSLMEESKLGATNQNY